MRSHSTLTQALQYPPESLIVALKRYCLGRSPKEAGTRQQNLPLWLQKDALIVFRKNEEIQ